MFINDICIVSGSNFRHDPPLQREEIVVGRANRKIDRPARYGDSLYDGYKVQCERNFQKRDQLVFDNFEIHDKATQNFCNIDYGDIPDKVYMEVNAAQERNCCTHSTHLISFTYID